MSGAIEHTDSLGNTATIQAGEVQRMSAGKGVTHSEMNNGKVPVHLLQIWIHPNQTGLPPSYQQVSTPLYSAQ
jgi:redox-sensitive bicupin YhaK (pirin superfamily)